MGVAALSQERGRWVATWDGDSPMLLNDSRGDYLEITDRTLTHYTDVATSRTDMELERYTSMCVKAGKALAGFIL